MKTASLTLVLAGLVCAEPPLSTSGGVSAPVPIHKVQPEYTAAAKAAGVEGWVVMSAVVDANGRTTEIVVRKTTFKLKATGESVEQDFGLSGQAVKAAQEWRFKPGEREGKPVAVQVNLELSFRLPVGPVAMRILGPSSPAVPLHRLPAVQAGRTANEKETVLVELVVGVDGRVLSARIVQTQSTVEGGPEEEYGGYRAMALQAAQAWRFKPAYQDGRAVQSTVRLPVDVN